MTALKTVHATLNYFPSDGARRVYPGTAGYQRRKFDSQVISVSDIRGAEQDFHLETNGFQVIKHEWPETKVGATDAEVKRAVYPETIKLVKQV